jgi:holo-[acyl-carrier protein] synthase
MKPMAVGIDLVAVDRVSRMLERYPERTLERLLTEGERRYCLEKAVPARHVAARIAAKEAVYKALQGTEDARGIGWREIEVVHDWGGRPTVRLTGRAEQRFQLMRAEAVLLSLTHTDDLAGAMAVVT